MMLLMLKYVYTVICFFSIIFSIALFIRYFFFKIAVFSWLLLGIFIFAGFTILFYSFACASQDITLAYRFFVYGLISTLMMYTLYLQLILNLARLYNISKLPKRHFTVSEKYYIGIQVIIYLQVILMIVLICLQPIKFSEFKPLIFQTENYAMIYGWANISPFFSLTTVSCFLAFACGFFGFSFVKKRYYGVNKHEFIVYFTILISSGVLAILFDYIFPYLNIIFLPPLGPLVFIVLIFLNIFIIRELPVYERLMSILSMNVLDIIERAYLFVDSDLNVLYVNHFAEILFEKKILRNQNIKLLLPKKVLAYDFSEQGSSIVQINTKTKKYLNLNILPYKNSYDEWIGSVRVCNDYTALVVDYMRLSYNNNSINKRIADKNRNIIHQNRTLYSTLQRKSILEKKYRYLLRFDNVTNAYNEEYFFKVVNQKIAGDEFNFTIFSIDIQDFKYINDLRGHYFGDLVLVKVSEIIQDVLGNNGIFARTDADNFLLLHDSISDAEDALIFSRVLSSVVSGIKTVDDIQVELVISIGICIYEKEMSAEEVITNAQLANLEADVQSNTKYVVFNPEISKTITERFKLISEIKRGSELDEFIPFFQPQVKVSKDGEQRIIGYEALARWNHSTRGVLSPYFFIEQAESSGAIINISYSILRQSCLVANELRSRGFKDFTISVNLSTKQLDSERFIHTVTEIFEDTKVDPTCIELEITETELLIYNEHILQKLFELKKMGVHIAIDDFGVGFASFNYIKRFPVDKIKIDKTFIDKINENKRVEEILSIVLQFAKICNLEIVVEGVEEKSQIDFFLDINDSIIVQGYYFYKPVSFETILENNIYPEHVPQLLGGAK